MTMDADNDGTFELSDSLNQSDKRSFYGYYDVATSHRPAATVAIHCSGTWQTPNAWAVAVYKLHSPSTTTGTMLLSGGGAHSLTGTRKVAGTALLTGGGSNMAVGIRKTTGTMLLSGGGTHRLAQQGVAVISGTMALVGGGTHTAQGGPVRFGTMTLTGGGTNATTGTRTTHGTMLITGGGTHSLAQLQSVRTKQAGGTWSSSSSLRLGNRTFTGTMDLSGGGTHAATGHVLVNGHGIGQMLGGGTHTAAGHPYGVRDDADGGRRLALHVAAQHGK